MREITENQWLAEFKPLPNPIDASCGYDYGAGCCLVETFGKHLDYLRSIPENRIWTVMDNDDGNPCISSGMSFVNRLGYIVTENPFTEDVYVNLDD
jgi:hypothetical protein